MRKRSIILTLIGALVVTLGFAYLTMVDDPIRPYVDYGLDAPERTAERGPQSTIQPVDAPPPTTAPAPTTGGHGGYEDPDEKDSPEEICFQQGLEWDGTQCYQPQLPEETIGRELEPAPPVQPPSTEPDNCN